MNERYCHLKLDGHMLYVEPKFMFTKNFINIADKLAFLRIPQHAGFRVLGELWAPGVKASAVKTLINEQSDQLRFTAWAVEGLPVDEPLEQVDGWCAEHGFAFCQYWTEQPVELPPHAEGYVFKDGNLLNYRKWKPVLTVDAVVTGIVPGKGKYEGLVGSLACSIEGREIATVGGMTDAERVSMGVHNIGQVVEIAYQYVGSKGRLRHPRFIRFRDDKDPSQCLLEQLDG